MLHDIDHYFGNDASVSPTGDLGSVSGIDRSKQRILRRLLTNPAQVNPDGSVLPADYIFHPTYGAGLGRYIGNPAKENEVLGNIRSQLALEDAVSQNPAPAISIQFIADGISVSISYVDSESNAPTTLSFTVSN